MDTRTLPAHPAPTYLGRSAVAGDAMRCDRCGAHWYPDMGERPPAVCVATPDAIRLERYERPASPAPVTLGLEPRTAYRRMMRGRAIR